MVKACRFGEHVWHSKPAVRDLQLSRGDPQKEEEHKQLSKVPSAMVVIRQEEQANLERRLHSRSLTGNCISSSSLVKSVVARPTLLLLLLQSIILNMTRPAYHRLTKLAFSGHKSKSGSLKT